MSTIVRLDPSEVLSYSSEPTVDLSERLTRESQATVPPYSVPRSQVYYWSYTWQSGESESLAAIEEGRGVRFASGDELADWLLSEHDEPS